MQSQIRMPIEPPWPLNEPGRIESLKGYDVLDTPAEVVFDRITRLAARHFDMPIALVSLVDETRQWFKSRFGLEVDCTRRQLAFCAYTILEERVLVVPDAAQDDRFSQNPLVTDSPGIRFYAGAPLRTPDGYLLGTLCIIDRKPHLDFDETKQTDLQDFATMVMYELEGRRAILGLQCESYERKRLEQELRKQAERVRLALASGAVYVFSQDRDLRYTWINDSPLGQAGVPAAGMTDADIFPPEDVRRLSALKKEVLRTGQKAREVIDTTILNERRVYDLIVEPLFDDTDEPSGVMCAAIDVTENRRITEDLARAKAEAERARAIAERANRAKSRFLAAASHDLRQPFQAMGLLLHLLLARLQGRQPELEIAQRLHEALTAGEGLLRSLLDISTLEAGIIQPQIVRLPIGELLARLARELEGQAADKGIALRVVPCTSEVLSDPVLLERIIRNLLVNALRYTEKGGILLGCRCQSSRVRIEVWDTGPGIPPDKLQSIFEEFFQVGNPERDRRRGLGLGLAIVERTATLLGHRTGVRSVLGQGSVFWVEVPRAEVGGQPCPSGQPTETVEPTGSVIAVVEDDPEQLTALRLMLESWGCSVVAASSPDEALAGIGNLPSRPDAIISDFRLRGGLTGLDAIREIREDANAALPAIVITGDTDPQRLKQVSQSGCLLLHKPFKPEELRAALQRALM
ncbi:MAG TPA: ATP-binding protein [Azospirillaceae bacterium]|nr:ATP-binding protein [Azospirillaceae bacterium]